MFNRYYYDPREIATRVIPSPTHSEGRYVVIGGSDKVTSRGTHMSPKSAAEFLEKDQEIAKRWGHGIMSDEQRAMLQERAKSHKAKGKGRTRAKVERVVVKAVTAETSLEQRIKELEAQIAALGK